MKLFDIFTKLNESTYYDTGEEFYHADEDQTMIRLDDTRKTKLTLARINKMRRVKELKSYENEKYLAKIKQIYGAEEESDDF